jgi:hypothetical protein
MEKAPRRMQELELESAICRALPALLPDLFKAGYRIKSQQAILLGRRIDLLLETSDGHPCIIELKAGAPPMPQVRDQILDYAECWRLSYPASNQLRLIVIGNSIPDVTKTELSNFGVESRAITQAQVLAALESQAQETSVPNGLKLLPDDLAKVRHLLSDYGAITVPEGLLLQPPWDHLKVFLALVKREEKHKDLWKKNPYVQLYPQTPNCAVLYGPTVASTTQGPLHLNDKVSSWNDQAFQQMQPFIKYVFSDNKGPGRERSNFDWYSIKDWNGFAASLGL